MSERWMELLGFILFWWIMGYGAYRAKLAVERWLGIYRRRKPR
jgi:hypothetical protein